MKKILFILVLMPILGMAQTTTENYTKATTYRGAGATNPSIQVTYFDGLGRPVQQIANAQSNLGKDIVTHIEYDAFGRQTKEYLPYANATPSLNYNPNAATEVGNFYNTAAYESTQNPYSEKELENSPLNRVFKQAAPGNAWALGSGHELKMEYLTNAATEVKFFKATTTWNASNLSYSIGIADNVNYAANELYKTVTKDENWTSGDNNTTQEFKDKNGKVILKRTFNNNDAGVAVPYDTYYVYDSFGNLTYVLPPLAEGAFDTNILNGLCYQYKYDDRNRLVAKKLPGKQWEYIVYDRLDRPVATGPAFSPWGEGTVGMLITEYDAFGRTIQTGWRAMTITETDRSSKQNSINSGINPFALRPDEILTKNYYDNYAFLNEQVTFPTSIEGQTVATGVKGKATGYWVRVLTGPNELDGETSYTLYDTKYRPIRTETKNYLGGYTQVDTKLDFIGKTLYTLTRHSRDGGVALVIKDSFEYTAQDRLKLHKQQINNLPEQLIASNTYDALGQLISKNVGGVDATGSLGLQKVDYTYNIRGWLKGINNIVDLAQGLDPIDLFAFGLSYNDYTINGSYANANATLLYNGNIAQAFWRTSSDNVLRQYDYDYDDLNRLTHAIYSKTGMSTMNSYGESLSYDKNGNIKDLIRNGEYDDAYYAMPMDELEYGYDTVNKNQLIAVYDRSNNPKGFKDEKDVLDLNSDGIDYEYDANGNMTSDTNKNINSIQYNHLNLPTSISFNGEINSGAITYIYNALGQKVKKKVEGLAEVTTDYLNGFQYKDGELQFFPHAEGYVNNTVANGNNNFNYVFNYTDHLGNVRLSYTNSVNGLEILEENNYYPFGLKHANYNMDQKNYQEMTSGEIKPVPVVSIPYNYKFNGKELQDELGLNMYDFGFRNYDPGIGRWMNMDPKAEQMRRHSPYNYAFDNPVYFIDPDGMKPDDWKKDAKGNMTYDPTLTATNQNMGKLGVGERYVGPAASEVVTNDSGTYRLNYNVDGSISESNNVSELNIREVQGVTSRETATLLQNVGDGLTILGALCTVTGVLSEVGVPMMAAGGKMALAGTAMELRQDAIEGDLTAEKFVTKAAMEVIPGVGGNAAAALGAPAAGALIEAATVGADRALDAAKDAKVGPYRDIK